MKKICNSCGKEFDENALMHTHTAENGTEYLICDKCETNGVEITAKKPYYICKNCGFPHDEEDFNGICKFCSHKDCFEKIELTEPEEKLLDEAPDKLYKEKLGEDASKKIAEWIESPERDAVGERHRRDRKIDGFFVLGIILSYILLDFDIRGFVNDKFMFIALLIPTVLVLITAPVFKEIDKKPRKNPLPIWLILVFMAVFVDLYWIVLKFLG